MSNRKTRPKHHWLIILACIVGGVLLCWLVAQDFAHSFLADVDTGREILIQEVEKTTRLVKVSERLVLALIVIAGLWYTKPWKRP